MNSIARLIIVAVCLFSSQGLRARESEAGSTDTRALEQLIRGNTAAQQGNAYQAIFHYQEALRFDPQSAFLHVVLSEQFVALGQVDRALGELDLALSLNDEYIDALHMKARILATSGSHKEAEKLYRRLIHADSGNVNHRIELLGLSLVLTEYDQVDDLYKQIPGDHALREDLLRRIIATYLTAGEISRSTEYLVELAALDSTESSVAYTLGTVYLQNGDTVRAQSEIERAIAQDSTDARAWYVRVVMEFDREMYAEAIAICERAAVAAGEDARTLNLQGLSNLRLGDTTQAISLLDRALELDSTLFTAAGSLALLFDQYDSLSCVEELYESAIRNSDSAAVYLNNLSYSYAERGVNLDRAMLLVDLALIRDADNPSYLDTKGWILHRRGEHRAALKYVKRAIKKDRASAPLYEHAGDICDALNKRGSAENYWKKALELNPKSESLRAKLGD